MEHVFRTVSMSRLSISRSYECMCKTKKNWMCGVNEATICQKARKCPQQRQTHSQKQTKLKNYSRQALKKAQRVKTFAQVWFSAASCKGKAIQLWIVHPGQHTTMSTSKLASNEQSCSSIHPLKSMLLQAGVPTILATANEWMNG